MAYLIHANGYVRLIPKYMPLSFANGYVRLIPKYMPLSFANGYVRLIPKYMPLSFANGYVRLIAVLQYFNHMLVFTKQIRSLNHTVFHTFGTIPCRSTGRRHLELYVFSDFNHVSDINRASTS